MNFLDLAQQLWTCALCPKQLHSNCCLTPEQPSADPVPATGQASGVYQSQQRCLHQGQHPGTCLYASQLAQCTMLSVGQHGIIDVSPAQSHFRRGGFEFLAKGHLGRSDAHLRADSPRVALLAGVGIWCIEAAWASPDSDLRTARPPRAPPCPLPACPMSASAHCSNASQACRLKWTSACRRR